MLKALRDWPDPTSGQALGFFLDKLPSLRTYIPRWADDTEMLKTAILRETSTFVGSGGRKRIVHDNVVWCWTEEHKMGFEEVEENIYTESCQAETKWAAPPSHGCFKDSARWRLFQVRVAHQVRCWMSPTATTPSLLYSCPLSSVRDQIPLYGTRGDPCITWTQGGHMADTQKQLSNHPVT